MGNVLKRLDWGHVVFVVCIAALSAWYLGDAIAASPRVENLILIAPAAALALGLCALIIGRTVYDAATADASASPRAERTPLTWSRMRPVAFIVLFGLYVAALEPMGFDVASWLFIAAALVLTGERRIWVIVGYAVVFGSLAVWLFGLMMPYPMPTLVVPVQ